MYQNSHPLFYYSLKYDFFHELLWSHIIITFEIFRQSNIITFVSFFIDEQGIHFQKLLRRLHWGHICQEDSNIWQSKYNFCPMIGLGESFLVESIIWNKISIFWCLHMQQVQFNNAHVCDNKYRIILNVALIFSMYNITMISEA